MKIQPITQYMLNEYTRLFNLTPDDTLETLIQKLNTAHTCEQCYHYTPVNKNVPIYEQSNFCYAYQMEYFSPRQHCPECNADIDDKTETY